MVQVGRKPPTSTPDLGPTQASTPTAAPADAAPPDARAPSDASAFVRESRPPPSAAPSSVASQGGARGAFVDRLATLAAGRTNGADFAANKAAALGKGPAERCAAYAAGLTTLLAEPGMRERIDAAFKQVGLKDFSAQLELAAGNPPWLGRALEASERGRRLEAMTSPGLFEAYPTFVAFHDRHVFVTDHFRQRSCMSKKDPREQPWLEWHESTGRFELHETGATERILADLGETGGLSLYRGTSGTDRNLYRGLKHLLEGKLGWWDAHKLRSALSDLRDYKVPNPENPYRKIHMYTEEERAELAKLSDRLGSSADELPIEERRALAFAVLRLANIDRNDGNIFATPSLEGAAYFAHDNHAARFDDGRVLRFAVDLAAAPANIREGLYAGIEHLTSVEVPAYFELGFHTPEAKLWLIEHLDEDFVEPPHKKA